LSDEDSTLIAGTSTAVAAGEDETLMTGASSAPVESTQMTGDTQVAMGDATATPVGVSDTMIGAEAAESSTTQLGDDGGDATQIASSPAAPVDDGGDATQIASAPAAGGSGEATQMAEAASAAVESTMIAAEGDATQIDDAPPAMAGGVPIPEFLGKYKIEKVLGKGAMGIVYKGVDPVLGRTVAIKTVLTSLLDIGMSEQVMARFKREAQSASRINHPGIVSVYEYGQDGDTAFIAMEFVNGDELEELLESGHKLRIEDTVKVIDQILDALGVAHEQGVVHRDIKPANIIVTKRGAKIADFGIANMEDSSMTQMGEVLGTPNYMAPEQVYGQPVDGRTDLFAVGIILYQLLTGEKPFSGGSSATVMHRVVNNEPDAPSILNKLVPKGFDAVISKSMAKAPTDRYQTADEFQSALKDVLAGNAPAESANSTASANATVAEGGDNPTMSAEGIPEQLGKYKIEKVLGQGAMGVVYKGVDDEIKRTVAIKTILTNLLDHAQAEAILLRFKREAQAAGRLNHPNIVAVYEYGKQGDTAFIAMEYVKGEELEDALEGGKRMGTDDIKDVIGQLLDGLGMAHKNGVVHRDIKPANLIMTEDGIKIADFGIANVEESSMTQMGEVLGTPNYMSPEQVYGQPVDGRSDLFSVGIILYQLITGEKPFSGGAAATVMHRVVNAEPEAPTILNQLIPKGFDALIRKAMAKKPEDRFQTAAEFKEALNSVCDGGKVKGKVPSADGGGSGLKIAIGLLLVGAAAGAGVFLAPPGTMPWDKAPIEGVESGQTGVTGETTDTGIKAPPVVEKTGFVQVTTEPEGATVFINDKEMGVTPLRLEIPVGEHMVKISKANHYDMEMDLEVEEGAEIPLDLPLQKM
jgi:serine/threonine protein kinase